MKRKWVAQLTVRLALVTLTSALTGRARAAGGDPALGKALYSKDCAICHGAAGRGDGPAAPFLDPKPRDFTKGTYKIRSTISLPTDADLLRTISQGIPGTLMPSYSYLSEKERRALVTYVKSFSGSFTEGVPAPITIPNPPPQTPEIAATGKELYQTAGCSKCHGPSGTGDGPAAATLVDDWGDRIIPYDFTIPGKMKGGSTITDLYRTITLGVGGTPMPAYGDALGEENRWALAYYVLSLAGEAPPALAAGDVATGRGMFMGTTRFQNGGPPCIACHSIAGIGALGGGVMGPDLNPAYSKFGEDRLTAILTTQPFPTMNPLFANRPLTPEEQADLMAFLQQGVTGRPAKALGQLALLAAAGAAILLILAGLTWRRRLTEVRRPLLRRAA